MKKISVGDIAEAKKIISEKDIQEFSEISGDKNPLHLDDEFAGKSILKKKVAHGFLVGSYISALIGKALPGEGTIYVSQSMNFLAPVFVGDEITTAVKVLKILSSKRFLLKTTCTNQVGKTVIEGEAVVIAPL